MRGTASQVLRRVLALLVAALLVAGLVPALPEAPSALAQETEGAVELGGEDRPSGEDNGDGVISVVGDGAGEGTEAAGPEAREGVGADSAGRDEDAMFATQAVSVSNPQVRADSSMAAGQVATWDCVWFGSYPQTEITSDDTVYFRLQNASWDANGDVMIDNTKYRRISSSDTIYSGYWSDDGYGYEAYRYFRYDPIKWRVLGISGSDALVVADKALDDQGYNTYNTDVTWATSSVRSWLNGYGAASNQPGTDYSLRSFLGTAFSSGERSAILTTDVVNADSTYYGTAGGAGTRDRVFLLSEAEVCGTAHGFASGYSTYDESRRCMPTDFAHAMGVYRYSGGLYDGNCWWWLRSPGATSSGASCVSYVGSVPIGGYGVTPQFHAVRPALNLNLASPHLSWAGTVSSNGDVNEQAAPSGGSVTDGSYEGYTWQFPNSPAVFGLEGDDYYIMWSEYNRLRDALPRADWLRITMKEDSSNQLLVNYLNPGGELPSGLYKKWNGSCYGMSVWSCLVANGVLSPSYLGSGYARLRDVPFSGGAESAINFYQAQQRTRIAKQRAWTFNSKKDQHAQLQALDNMAASASVERPFKLFFNWQMDLGERGWEQAGHVTVGYGREPGSWTLSVGGKTDTYTSRVWIYDCSHPGSGDFDKACLYYNVAGNLWCIPKWNIRSTSNEAEKRGENNGMLVDIESDPDKLNIVDITTGRYSTDGEAITAAFLESEAASYALVANGKGYAVDGLSVSGPDNDVAVIVDPEDDSETGLGSATAVFTDGSGDVKVSSDDPVGFSLSGQGTYRSASAGSGGEVVFGEGGSCSVSSNDETGISILVAPDDGEVAGFGGLAVTAAGSRELELTPTTDGLVVEGDNLDDLNCSGIDLDGASGGTEVAASSNRDSVLVRRDGGGLSVYEDRDGDGSYERRVASANNDLSKATIGRIPDQAYTGGALTPAPTVKLNGVTLKSGKDYTVSYRNNTNVGTATVAVTGKGAYSGTKSATFRIVWPFSDVTDEVAHHEDISWLAQSGISRGWDMPDGTVEFRPYADVARADMAAFLFRLAKSWDVVDDTWQPTSAQKRAFSDVDATTAHYREIMWLAESGISKGWDVTGGRKEFRPYANVARADMAAFLHRLAAKAGIGDPAGGGVSFRDVTARTAHADDISWLAATGVSKGWDVAGGKKEFRPLAYVARADMAAFLHRLDGLR